MIQGMPSFNTSDSTRNAVDATNVADGNALPITHLVAQSISIMSTEFPSLVVLIPISNPFDRYPTAVPLQLEFDEQEVIVRCDANRYHIVVLQS